jgi:hypothetical protein
MNFAWEPWDGLPPLPFPRLWIEWLYPEQSGPVPFPSGDIDAGDSWSATSYWSSLFGVSLIPHECTAASEGPTRALAQAETASG